MNSDLNRGGQISDPPLLKVEGLTKHFIQSDGLLDRFLGNAETVHALDNVDLEINKGETFGVVGESGCGKSTLARTLIGIHDATEGQIKYSDRDATDLSGKQLKEYRKDVQMIFQDPLSSLNPRQSVGTILKAPMEAHDIGDSDEERMKRAKDQLRRVGLEPNHVARYPHQFSGGQQQRIAIARALTLEPKLLIADEPVSALDVSVQAQILELLQGLQDELELTILFIAHDLSVIRYIADRVAVMYLGEIMELAPTSKLFEEPKHPYTKALLSAVPRINRDVREERDRTILRGAVPSPIDPPSGCRFHTRCPEIIPPEKWSGTQEEFKAGFDLRTRIHNEEIDPKAIRTRLEAKNENVTEKDIKEQILRESLPIQVGAYPKEIQDQFYRCASHVIDGDWSEAQSLIQDTFTSPCQQKPERVEPSPKHTVACLRVEQNPPAGRTDSSLVTDRNS
ncbi:ABC transporter ATP-binding protein [Halorubrum trueperi]|uniref:ABC transporter ATP-binding protein n=1 Tax=Halorubrum trueperi TaxID=2004704 RepID=A0ABD5ULM1_9EURY